MKNLANTNYGRKALFDEILSKNLDIFKYKIDAFYESISNNRIMSIRISEDKTVHLGINVSFKSEEMFSDSADPMGLSLAFRAYFIINYLRCLESADESLPTSYFYGLVILESVNDLLSLKKRFAYVPDSVGVNKNLRPIDVHCAIRAVTRVLADYGPIVSEESSKLCEAYRDTFIYYTGSPETEYVGSKHAKYTVLCEAGALESLIAKHPEVTENFALFSCVGFDSLKDMSVEALLSACDENKNAFWSGFILRMFSISQHGERLKKYLGHPCIKTALEDFRVNSVEYCFQHKEESVLSQNNRQAVQMLVRGSEQLSGPDLIPQNGAMHYIR